MIIEFIGLPGAGKSTLSHQVAALLRAAGETVSEESFNLAHRRGPIRRRLVKVRFAVATLLRFPIKSAALVRMIAPARSATPVATTVKTLELLYVCGLVAQQARRPGIHLLDQGFFTSLGAVCLDTQARVALGPLIDLGSACCRRSPADLVVVLEVSPGTVLSRLADRPGRTSRLEKRAAEPGFDRHLRAAVGLLERIRGAIGAPDRPWEVQVVREHDPGSATMLAERIKSATVSPFFPPSKTTAVVSLSHED
jgi:thymidylate kinase